ncbi:hypothetical protein EI94DRAFT_1302297 [Lactarius quietus]|nr:hypothetical protein EI94DRAFT_1302297 [Lactarius quietus]
MTGANYTGGKRNFARARFRDSTRRAQKSHFGRRRLEILSRGLGNGARSKEEEPSGISGILLEHAQREISRPPEYMRSTRTEAPDTFSGLFSPSISEHGINPSKVVRMMDSQSRKSLRSFFFFPSAGWDIFPKILPSEQKRIGFSSFQEPLDFAII